MNRLELRTIGFGIDPVTRLATQEIEGIFFVPSYQRGYRWTADEVTKLLDDIYESGCQPYSLQPIVLQTRNTGAWELTDGQQRLTTLWLLLRFMNKGEPRYRLEYQTRPGCQTYLQQIDTDWADLFWQYRSDNDLIDEGCMRYLRFLLEEQAWKRNIPVKTRRNDLQVLSAITKPLLGGEALLAVEGFNWMAPALDVWLEDDNHGDHKPKAIVSIFTELFTREASSATIPLRIFNFGDFGDAPVGVNLFHACCMLYGTRSWSLSHTLMLYGVLIGFMAELSRPDLQRRLRLLRNLIEASRNEIRADDTRNNMPALLREVDIIMAGEQLTGLVGINTFNQVQVRNEQDKLVLMATHPALQEAADQLEDHELLRGGLIKP